ncbi:flagellar assembly protein FliH [Massilia horti]|uniref:Flagellar assembly protein FliH n=1 Tax=Massilia horti TaxID=2562153 RepID=A0A4Y9SYA1_9BURK|nr:flagellar assembly protein FliH [Massilia horti]TFW31419.1 flagellar assembly protein H [Massilia horti]
MKSFRPYHFPPLSQLSRAGAPAAAAGREEAWQGAVADGYRQGQRDGYDSGLEQGRGEGFPLGHAEGVVRGLEEGRAQAQAHFGQLAGPVDAILASLEKLQKDFREAQRKEVVDLVGKIARQVIRAELALQPVQLLALVDEALAAMPPTRDTIEVSLNPEELRRITELDPKRAAKWTLLPDPGLEPGECRVKAGDLEVDAGCQGRLAAVMEQVGEQLAASGEEQ